MRLYSTLRSDPQYDAPCLNKEHSSTPPCVCLCNVPARLTVPGSVVRMRSIPLSPASSSNHLHLSLFWLLEEEGRGRLIVVGLQQRVILPLSPGWDACGSQAAPVAAAPLQHVAQPGGGSSSLVEGAPALWRELQPGGGFSNLLRVLQPGGGSSSLAEGAPAWWRLLLPGGRWSSWDAPQRPALLPLRADGCRVPGPRSLRSGHLPGSEGREGGEGGHHARREALPAGLREG